MEWLGLVDLLSKGKPHVKVLLLELLVCALVGPITLRDSACGVIE